MSERGSHTELEPQEEPLPVLMLNVFPGMNLKSVVEAVSPGLKAVVLITDAGGGMGKENIPVVGELVEKGIAVIVLPDNANASYGMTHFSDQPAQDVANLGGTYIESPSDIPLVHQALKRALSEGLTGQELAHRIRDELVLPPDAPRASTDPYERMARFQEGLEAAGLAGDWKDVPSSRQILASLEEAIDMFGAEDKESQVYLETVLLPELSEALGEELDLSSNTLGRLKDLSEEYRLDLE